MRFETTPAAPEEGAPPIPLNTPPPPAPFPLALLPSALRAFVEESAASTNTEPDYTAAPLLALAGAAVGSSRALEILDSYHESACLWVVIVGEPGSNKSAPLRFAAAPFYEMQRQFKKDHDKGQSSWAKAAVARRPPEPPPMRRAWTDDTTAEPLLRVLAENERGLAIIADEVSGFLAGLNQYKSGGKGNDAQRYLKIFSHVPVGYDRSKLDGKPLMAMHPFLAIAGGIQPDVLQMFRAERHAQGYVHDGLLDRFLFSYPRELPARGARRLALSREARTVWAQTVAALCRLKMLGKEGSKRPALVRLTPEAWDAWVAATDAHAAEVNAPDFPRYLKGPWAKMCTYMGRLTLVMQLLRWACRETETEHAEARAVKDAEAVVGYFKNHARRCYRLMGMDPRVADAMVVLRWLAREPGLARFSRSDAWQVLRSSFPGPDSLNAPLAMLAEHRYLERLEPEAPPPGKRGRRGTDEYTVNPLWDRANNTNNPNN